MDPLVLVQFETVFCNHVTIFVSIHHIVLSFDAIKLSSHSQISSSTYSISEVMLEIRR